MFRTIMERLRHRREVRRISRSHRHGGRRSGGGTGADSRQGARARAESETMGRQGGFGDG
ncbi:MAG: hypothetical protein AAF480_09750 [Actinomycetota bacterium]